MKLLNFNIIKLTLCLIVGILIASIAPFSLHILWIATLISLLILAVVFFLTRKQFKQNSLFGIFSFITTILIGSLIFNLQNEKLNTDYYSHLLIEDNVPQKITLQIKERLKPSLYYEKYITEVLELNNQRVSGKILLNISKDSLTEPFRTDDVIVGEMPFKRINNPLNPYQFNYREYLGKQSIYHQVFIQEQQLIVIQSKPTSIRGYAARIRSFINKKLKEHSFSVDQLALINALFLGQRQDIERDVYENYTKAGVVHILAISGLHIGIILLMLQFLLKPLEKLKHGNVIKASFIIILLWSFAIVAGLSASVTRAVAMFTIFAIAMNLKRPTNVYNTLAISAFFILLFKPKFLFDVGFQLSYLAVLGIVAVQPILYKIIKRPKFWIPNKFWEIITVTAAAQFGILPLSLYYFHQFPGLLFISNLVIIPILGIILGLGFFVIILAVCNLLPEFLVTTFGSVISFLNSFVLWVANKEDYLIQNISFSIPEVLASYLVIISLILFLKNMKLKTFIGLLASVILFQSTFIWKKYTSQEHEFVVFHKSRHTLIGEKNNDIIAFYHNLDNITNERMVNDFITGSYSKTYTEDSLIPVYIFDDKIILLIDSLGVYQVKSYNLEIVLLRNSPKINLNRLIDSLKPEQIIADGSNYKSYVERWKATCKKRKIPFHSTYEKGAFILK